MLGKIMKHEWIATGKILVPVHVLLLVITAIGKIEFSVGVFDSTQPVLEVLSVATIICYILSILAAGFVTMIYLLIRFYKSMFTDEGYLTFTLPVKPNTILNGKMIVSFCWMLIDTILVCLSIFFLLLTPETWQYITTGMPDLTDAVNTMGWSLGELAGWLVAIGLVEIIYLITSVMAALCIGQLFGKHKIAASVLAYFVIYLINQVVGTIVMMASGFIQMLDETIGMSLVFNRLFLFSTVMSIICSVIFYLISTYIINKKLNLD